MTSQATPENLQQMLTAAASNPVYAQMQAAVALATAQNNNAPGYRTCQTPQQACEVIKELTLAKCLIMGAPQVHGHEIVVWYWQPRGK